MLSFGRQLDTGNLKCSSLDNQECLARPKLIDLNPKRLRCYKIVPILGSCKVHSNIIDYLSCYIEKDVNLKVFKTISGIN